MDDIIFGATAPPLAEQLKGVRITAEKMKAYQADADAITRLNLRDILSDSEARKARGRILRSMAKVSR